MRANRHKKASAATAGQESVSAVTDESAVTESTARTGGGRVL
jgi:hypothetical protein